MKRLLVKSFVGALILIFGILEILFAQITVTAADAPSELGITFEMSSQDFVNINLGQTGANQYWDFSSYTLPNKSSWQVIAVETSPFYSHFPEANVVYQVTRVNNDTIDYNYIRLTETDLTELGRGKIAGTDVTELLDPKRATPKLHLPATYGDANWTSVLEMDTTFGVLDVTVIDSSDNSIDAWGIIKTGFGEFPCLRVRQDHIQIVYLPYGFLIMEQNINYFWITNVNGMGIVATVTGINGEKNPNYTVAKSITIITDFVTSVEKISDAYVPQKFELYQNFPNPFNPKTEFRYQLKEPREVFLRVFNIAGQEVALLVHAQQQPGMYEIQWDAGKLPSGVYYYQIKSNGSILTKSCLLVK